MRFIHLSDLHIGKRINGFCLDEDQRYILNQIADIAGEEKADAVVIAGDVYDKSIPPAEAVGIFDDFLFRLSKMGLHILIISGNHDSAVRLGFAGRIMENNNIHICTEYTGSIHRISVKDADFYLLPFIKPVNVRNFFAEKNIESYDDALRAVVEKEVLDSGRKNIMVSHQFITNSVRCDSETISVGGSDNISADIFYKFDYTALGHIHGPQNAGGDNIRYCGSPLKYSFSEEGHKKSVTVVDTSDMSQRHIPLSPLHDMRTIKGPIEKLMSDDAVKGADSNDYIRAVLTDEDEVIDAIGKMRSVYPNIMQLEYENRRSKAVSEDYEVSSDSNKTPDELFSEFYLMQNGAEPDERKMGIIKDIFANLGDE